MQWSGDYEYPTITGFYGPATEAAVKHFQIKYNIVTSGLPDTTGFGAVGPKTKKVIEELSCKGTTSGGVPSITITSPNAGGVWVKGLEYQVYWTKTSFSSTKELMLTLVRADNSNEVILKKGVDNDLKATVKVPIDIQAGSYYLKIAGVVDGVVVSDLSDVALTIQDPTPGDGIFTASPLTVVSGGTVTFQFAWTGANAVRLYLECPAGVTAKALYPEKETISCNTFTNYLGASSAAFPTVFTSTLSSEAKVKAKLYGYLSSTGTYDKILGTKELGISVLPPFTSAFTITSPNGGETWEQGTTQTVTWEKVNISSQKDAKLSLESTNGTQYILKTGVENDLKTTIKVPTDILIGSYKLIIQANVNGIIVKDMSDGYINVVAPNSVKSVTILSPNGGEKFEVGKTYTLKWKTSGNITTVNLLLEHSPLVCDATGFCNNPPAIATFVQNTGSYVWTIPSTFAPGNYSFIIQEQGNTSTPPDKSDAPFSIIPAASTNPSLTVLAPNGGEKWGAFDKIEFTWKANYAPIEPVAYLYGPTDPAVATKPLTFVPSIEKQTDSFVGSQIPVSGEYKVTICDEKTDNPLVPGKPLCDSSDNFFTFTKNTPPGSPSLTVLAPNGGESYELTKEFTVTWSSANIPAGQTVTVVGDNITTGINGYTLAYQTVNDGIQKVTLPSVATAGSYKVRVYTTVNNATVTDSSDATFTVTQNPTTLPTFTVLTPNGGEVWVKGADVYPTWTDQNISSEKKIDLYVKNVATGKEYPFALSVYNDGKTTAPKVTSDVIAGDYKFVVKALVDGKTISDESDAPFMIQEKVTFTSYKATDPTLNSNSTVTFSWQSTHPVKGLVKMNCSSTAVITFSIAETGKVPYCNSIIANYNDAAKTSDSFTIVPQGNTQNVSVDIVFEAYQGNYAYIPPVQKVTVVFPPTKQGVTLNLVSPNGGETLEYGKNFDVTWSSTNLAASQLVTVVADNVTTGINGYTLAYLTGNDGKQSVSLPSVAPAGTYKVRIYTTFGGTTYTDTSDGTINITSQASFTLISPKGGEAWTKGSSYTVTWSDTNVASTKNVDLYFVDASGAKFVLNKGVENDGAGTPKVSSEVPAGTYYIQIEAVVDGAVIFDKSDGTVTVSEKPAASSEGSEAAQLAAILDALQKIAAQLQTLIASE